MDDGRRSVGDVAFDEEVLPVCGKRGVEMPRVRRESDAPEIEILVAEGLSVPADREFFQVCDDSAAINLDKQGLRREVHGRVAMPADKNGQRGQFAVRRHAASAWDAFQRKLSNDLESFRVEEFRGVSGE